MKKLLLLPLAIFALTACDNGKDPVDPETTEPGQTEPVEGALPQSDVAPKFQGFSLTGTGLTVIVNAPAKCTFSAANIENTVMQDVSANGKYAHAVNLKGKFVNATVTCENTAGKTSQEYGTLVVGN